MNTIRFILQKIIIVEGMLIILFFAINVLGVSIPLINTIIGTSLTFLTPIAVIALILYVILSLLSSRIIETALGVILGGLILYYIFKLR